jgi:hypothetical protein
VTNLIEFEDLAELLLDLTSENPVRSDARAT